MGESTAISWTDLTWSPWTGCTKVSPACDGCYAAHLMDTRMHRVEWGEPGVGDGTRDLMSEAYWRKLPAWERAAAATGTRPFVFPSLRDPFDLAVPSEWRRRWFRRIEETPHLVWLLLTKRIGNVRKLTDPERGEFPLPANVAVGATFANQDEWDRDWRKLREVRNFADPLFLFASFEPLLSGVVLSEWAPDWIIAGGETDQGSHKARPSHLSWFRSLRDQAARHGALFHFKQWGEWAHESDLADGGERFVRLGKRRAGRLLDGVSHDARPLAHA
jgi:protein gp37